MAIFIYILGFCEDITEKKDSNNTFQQNQMIWSFSEKKIKSGFINTIFLQSCMTGEFSPITKDVVCRKNKYLENWSIPSKQTWSPAFSPSFLVKFMRNSIKCRVSRLVSGALKVALLRAMTFKAQTKMIPESEIKNEFAALKLMC